MVEGTRFVLSRHSRIAYQVPSSPRLASRATPLQQERDISALRAQGQTTRQIPICLTAEDFGQQEISSSFAPVECRQGVAHANNTKSPGIDPFEGSIPGDLFYMTEWPVSRMLVTIHSRILLDSSASCQKSLCRFSVMASVFTLAAVGISPDAGDGMSDPL